MSDRVAENDPTLVKRSQAGDREAFARLIERHLGPSYGIAIAILGHDDDAEELVQEAVVHAWQGLAGLRNPNRFGAWLAQIIRNRAARQRRERARAARAVAGWSERVRAAPSEEERMNRREAAARLKVRVEALPEKLRIPLVLYYFEGLSSARAADRLGLEPATLRKRLQLARDQLRAGMETEIEQVASTLAPRLEFRRSLHALVLTLPIPNATATAGGLGASLGGFLMKKALYVVLSVLVALGGVAYWWPGDLGDAAKTETTPRPSVVERSSFLAIDKSSSQNDTSHGGTSRVDTSRDDAVGTAPSQPAPLLVGTVVDPDDRPVRGAVLHLFPRGTDLPPIDDAAERLEVSATGQFDSGDWKPGHYSLAVRAQGYCYRAVENLELLPQRQREIVLRLEIGFGISGIVLDPDGLPVSETAVSLRGAPEQTHFEGADGKRASVTIMRIDRGTLAHIATTTDARGAFQLRGISPGEYEVVATHEAWPTAVAGPVVAGTDDLEVRFKHGGELVGRVFDPTGTPVAGATIRVPDRATNRDLRRVLSDWRGRFRVRGLEESAVELRIEVDGYPPLRPEATTIVAGQSTDELYFVLEAGAAVQGIVHSAADRPLVGAQVELTVDAQGEPLGRAQTNADGTFDLHGLPTETATATLRIHAVNHLEWQTDVALEAGGLVDIGTIKLDRGSYVRGVVVDAVENVLEGVEVRTRLTGSGGRQLHILGGGVIDGPGPSTRTDSRGEFRVGPLPRESVQFEVRAAGYATIQKPLNLGEGDLTGVTFRLGDGHHFRGRVVDDTGAPLPGITVKASAQTISWNVSDANGDVSIVGLPDEYLIETRADAHVPFERKFSGDITTTLELPRTALLRGMVRSRTSGRPVPKFTVTVSDSVSEEGHELSLADLDGRYEAVGLAPGECTLRVDARGFASFFRHGLHLNAGEVRELDVLLVEGRTLLGRVVNQAGDPVPGTEVELIPPGYLGAVRREPEFAIVTMGRGQMHAIPLNRRISPVVTDAEGRFELTDAPPGPTRLRFFKPQYLEHTVDVGDTEVQVTLRSGGGVEGAVLLPCGAPCVGGLIRIQAVDREGFRPRLPVSIAEDGSYSISGLSVGQYELGPVVLMAAKADDAFEIVKEQFQAVVIRVVAERLETHNLELEVEDQ